MYCTSCIYHTTICLHTDLCVYTKYQCHTFNHSLEQHFPCLVSATIACKTTRLLLIGEPLHCSIASHSCTLKGGAVIIYCFACVLMFSYEQLVQLHPEVHNYQLYYAQCLYKACLFPEATKASCQLEHESYQTKVHVYLHVGVCVCVCVCVCMCVCVCVYVCVCVCVCVCTYVL